MIEILDGIFRNLHIDSVDSFSATSSVGISTHLTVERELLTAEYRSALNVRYCTIGTNTINQP